MLFMRERSGVKNESLPETAVVHEGEDEDYSKIKIVVMNNEENAHREVESFDQVSNYDRKESGTDPPPEMTTHENHSSSRRKRNFVTNKRLHPIYGKRMSTTAPHTIKKQQPPVTTAPPSPPPTPVNNKDVSSSGRLSENESFTQYMSSVLERFDEEKQRKCRSELLRIILKYDIGE